MFAILAIYFGSVLGVWPLCRRDAFLSSESTIYIEVRYATATYYAQAYDSKGEDCATEDSVRLEPRLYDCLWVPNTITPNFPSNNRFFLTMCNVQDFELLIFDR